ncbi:uncharacterized protein G2W53_044835 [Senna tora]|uniref:Uncharacterized protein n=1 Tax=Senna tora TaxID=362788 RepID=A0A834W1D4_9FABA|nr:uncharacterized protein G2W53_044835 [Senna tora]
MLQNQFCRIFCAAAEPFCRIGSACRTNSAECRTRTRISGLSQDFICSTLQADSAIAALNYCGVILDDKSNVQMISSYEVKMIDTYNDDNAKIEIQFC